MKRIFIFLLTAQLALAADTAKSLPPVPSGVAGQKAMGVALAENLRGMRLVKMKSRATFASAVRVANAKMCR